MARANNWPNRARGTAAQTPTTPTWLAGAAINEFVEITGTSGAGGAAIDAWGTLVLIDGTAILVSPANGGHTDSSDNRVTSIDLSQNAPSWTQQIAASSSVTANTDHMPDGKPVSRHGYHHAHYISQRSRVMLFGARGWYSNGGDGYKVDGHTVSGTWAWDAADTWTATAGSQGFGTARDPVTGNVWTNAGYLWNQAGDSWSNEGAFSTSWRWPVAYDSTREQFFTLQYGDGQGFDLGRGVVATIFDPATGAQQTISFNSSAALTQFSSEQPVYAGMDYDPETDKFLFYHGDGASTEDVFVITPNGTTTWDMGLLSVTGATPNAPPAGGSGINGRWKYIPALKGFALFPQSSSNMFFLRTA